MDDKTVLKENPDSNDKPSTSNAAKVDLSSLGIPNYIIEYDPINIGILCPRFNRFNNESANLEFRELDQVQLELETLLLDVMKRLRLLKNDLYPNEVNLRKNNVNLEVNADSRNLNDIPNEGTFGKYFDQVKFKKPVSILKKSTQNAQTVEKFLNTPYPNLNGNDITNQFWSFIHYNFDIAPTGERLKKNAEFLEMLRNNSISCANLNIKFENNVDKNLNKEEFIGLLEIFLKKFFNIEQQQPSLNEKYLESSCSFYGPLTKRLKMSLINVNDEKIIDPKNKEKTITDNNNTKYDVNPDIQFMETAMENMKSSSNVQRFERSLYKVLKRQKLTKNRIPMDRFYNFRKCLKKLNQENCKKFERYFKYSYHDALQDRLDRKFINNYVKMFEAYKVLTSSTTTLKPLQIQEQFLNFDKFFKLIKKDKSVQMLSKI